MGSQRESGLVNQQRPIPLSVGRNGKFERAERIGLGYLSARFQLKRLSPGHGDFGAFDRFARRSRNVTANGIVGRIRFG